MSIRDTQEGTHYEVQRSSCLAITCLQGYMYKPVYSNLEVYIPAVLIACTFNPDLNTIVVQNTFSYIILIGIKSP